MEFKSIAFFVAPSEHPVRVAAAITAQTPIVNSLFFIFYLLLGKIIQLEY